MATIDTIADRSAGSAVAGKAYFETSTNRFIVYNGSSWVELHSDGTGSAFAYNLTESVGLAAVPLLHLDASELSLSDGDPVTSWADKSGNGYNFTSSGSNSPVFRASGLLGHKTVQFDGIDDYLSNSSVLSQFSSQNVTLIAVYNDHANSTFCDLFDTGSQAGGDRLSPDYSSAFLGARINAVTENFAKPASGNNIFGLKVNSGTSSYELFYNKASQYQVSSYSFGVTSVMSIGGGNSSYKLDGEISEILLFNEVISDADWNTIHEYLSIKYFTPNIGTLSGSYVLDSSYTVSESPTFHFCPESEYLFKADGSLASSNDDKILAWRDKAVGNILAAHSTALSPTLKTSHVNGKNALYFDGSNLLSGSGVQSSFKNTNGDSTIIFAFDANGDSSADPIAFPAAGGARLIQGGVIGYMSTLRGARLSAKSHGVNINAPHITTITTSSSQNSYKIFGNGGSAVTEENFSNPGWNGKKNHFKVGGASATAYTLTGYIYEILFFDSALSDADLNIVGNYLGVKYGINYSNI